MDRLQVKYCKGEKELNDFLMTLSVGIEKGYPKLHSVNYVCEVSGSGHDYETYSGTRSTLHVDSSVVAAVQYFIKDEKE